MRNLLILAAIALALGTFACATTRTMEPQAITKGTKIKCPNCGVELTVGEGLKAVEKTP